MFQAILVDNKTKYYRRAICLCAVLACVSPVLAQITHTPDQAEDTVVREPETLHIRHPNNVLSDKIYAKREHYIVKLLDLAMSKSGASYVLEEVPLETVTANRNIRNLLSGQYDINWIHTNTQRENELLPIRIPIFKGLIGWRLLMIDKNRQDSFSSIKTLDDLKQMTAGQGHDWPDTKILQHHDFSLLTSTSRNSLINMLIGKRIDYFPRSVIEIWDELEVYDKNSLYVEETLALVYPSAYYFFTNKNNKHLAEVLEKGLNTALQDGSFNELFLSFYKESITRSKLSNRKIFYIDNPMLSPETPLDNSLYWFKPDVSEALIQHSPPNSSELKKAGL